MKNIFIEFSKKNTVRVKEEEINIDNLGDLEVVIRNEASLISAGTELSRLKGLEEGCDFPFRPGYASIGVIEKKGKGIKDFEIGEKVFYAGKHSLIQRFWHGADHQWANLFKIPQDLDPIEGALGCMAEIALTGPNITEINLNDTVAIFGLGTIGVLAGILYKLKGAKVIGIDPVKSRCEIARKNGIETTIDVSPEEQINALLDITNGEGAEVTVDAVGHSKIIHTCVKTTKYFGQVVLLGTPRVPYNTDATDIFHEVHTKGIIIRGAHQWRLPVRPQRGYPLSVEWAFNTVFDLIKNKKINAKNIITNIISPYDAPKAYEGLQNDKEHYFCVAIDWRKI